LTEAKSLEQSLSEAFQEADALQAPLGARLDFYLGESRRLLPDLEATYDQLVERIRVNGADTHVPAIGERLPDFLMTDSDGHVVELRSLIGNGPLVISFNRGPWCDYCGLELRALARAYPDIVAAGGEVVSIVPETGRYADDLRRVRDLPFRVLTDLDLLGWSSGWGRGSSRPIRALALILSDSKETAGGFCQFRRPSSSAGTASSRRVSSTLISATACNRGRSRRDCNR
jgi:hypothetical protein